MTLMRPAFLLLLLIWLPATYFWLRHRPQSGWHQVMDPDLFEHLKNTGRKNRFSNLRWPLPLFLLLLIFALSGPAIERTSSRTLSQGNLYVVLDNTLSMAIEDVSPNRLTRAKRMVIDWSRSGLFDKVTVLTYSGSAHVLTPMTADTETLELQLQSLTPYLMPAFGNRADLAFNKLEETLAPGPKHLLWLTDDIPSQGQESIRQQLANFATRSLVPMGTEQGGPIPLPNDQGFLQQDGSLVVVTTDRRQIRDRAAALGFSLLSAGDQPRTQWFESAQVRSGQSAVQTQDIGYWLLMPMLLIWGWVRRQALMPALALCLFTALPNPQHAMASTLFQNAEQQAFQAYSEADYDQAATLSENPMLIGESLFQQGQYELAAEAFGQSSRPEAHFNRGNALAYAGRYAEAIEAYEQAIAAGTDAPALQNKALVESFLQDQEAAEQNSANDDASGNNSQQNDEPSSHDGAENRLGSADPSSPPTAGESEPSSNETENSTPEGEAASSMNPDSATGETSAETSSDNPPDQPSAEALRAQQENDAILNRLEGPSGNLLQQKFRFQYQQNPTESDGTLW